ncbi:element excision factor XisI family protein [Chamaesiphon sp. OTE_75_metabat_556]|uniref:element excision factor XisI family protein n=1 Tax=Chamaesiphon sp. OTE_75_metabat_556 TaxID=2964692 RepID=UPI00286D2EB7|nr:element excision factor XisI family protein [Chamaesiphon sp. OTE_75_metabat_556]
MDKLNEYRQIVCQYLEDFAKNDKNSQFVFDRDRDRYLVLHNEWRGDDRLYGCAIQLDIIDGQIWIQVNNTEIYIERELIERGVDRQDIIFGFRSPNIRKLLAADRH